MNQSLIEPNDVDVISFYKFRETGNLAEVRSELSAICSTLNLKGTVLLAPEGINANVAGRSREARDFLDKMITDELADAEDVKRYSNSFNPFRRMLVKVRNEIITLGTQNVSVESDPDAYVSPSEFKKWLDDREDMIVLDTRNRYETAIGKFKYAADLDLNDFQEFPEKISGLNRKAKIVMYCTGGIRCEKAWVVMKNAGFENVHQLKGGILKFNEVYPATYFEGSCFVFDHRVAITADNRVSDYFLCGLCGNPTRDRSSCQVCKGPAHLCLSCSTSGDKVCSKRCKNDLAGHQNGASVQS